MSSIPHDDSHHDNLPAEPLYEPEDVGRSADPSPAEESQLHQENNGEHHDPLAALRFRDYRLYSAAGLIESLGSQVFSVAVGWELYARTHDAWTLGLVGLIQAIPVICLALPSGEVADRFDRRRIVLVTSLIVMLCWLSLAYLSFTQRAIWLYFVVLFAEATAKTFDGPARSALLPQLVPQESLANAVTWSSSRWQTAAMAGPALGGLAIGYFGTEWQVYTIATFGAFIAWLMMMPLRPHPLERPAGKESPWHRLVAGIHFIRREDLFLATITLDLFAVFLGGAVTLLPVFASDILHVGAQGLGWLRAAPAAGALLMSLWLSLRPPMQHAGKAMLAAVIGFGVATIVFGLSRNFWISLVALFLTGAFDNVSVVVRHTLLTVLTPSHMRGRVSAVNSVFIGSSNELGGFESGFAARVLGPIVAVVGGGIGTILVVLGVASIWPKVALLRSLDKMTPVED